jgi:hypothetical protein
VKPKGRPLAWDGLLIPAAFKKSAKVLQFLINSLALLLKYPVIPIKKDEGCFFTGN